ncbi:MAG TPA: 50S ribosomal protein L6, partial [Nitrososphaerales archaeon]|nr:50S ribosomal protein L6 [Nitrososphaerales archaeon]
MSTSVAAKAAQRKEDGARTVELPQGVSASVKGRELTVKGPNGSATKVFQRIPVDVEVKGNQVRITPFTGKKKDVISANT